MTKPFRFKNFSICQDKSALKVGTDAMLLGALSIHDHPEFILDIGAGSGVLSCMLLQKYPNAFVQLVEIDKDSIEDAQLNLSQSLFKQRFEIFHLNFLDYSTTTRFDLIISNPPFYENALLSAKEKLNLAKHVSVLKLEDLLLKTHQLINENGLFYFIWPSHDQAVFDTIQQTKWNVLRQIAIYGKPGSQKRWVFVLQKKKTTTIYESLIIRDEMGKYTTEYIALTADFHGVDLSKD